MDFDLTEDQAALAELTGRILGDRCSPDRLREIEQDGGWLAAGAWADLAEADLLGVALPEADGGGGYGLLGAALVLEQVGRHVAPVPYLASVVMGAMTVADYGSAGQRAALLPGVISGDLVLTAAVVEDGDPLPPAVPVTHAEPAGVGWALHGEKVFVPAAPLAHRILVPARTGEDATTVFLVDPAAGGASVEVVALTDREPAGHLRLDGVAVTPGDVLGPVDGGAAVVAGITDRALAGLCCTQSGVCEGALALTAAYTSERRQFGAPIATFQAVAQRAADAYVDTEAVRLTSRQAAWRLSEGLPSAEALAVAKFWAAEGAQRVVHAAQHLHGGIGVDVDYPVHRYFRWAKAQELSLGGGTRHLLRLGRHLADEPV